MIYLAGGKTYDVQKLPATAGRSLMVCGALPTRAYLLAWCKVDGRRFLQATSAIRVKLTADHMLPLSSFALVDNHVADQETLMDLVWMVIDTSFPGADLLNGERLTVWKMGQMLFDQCVDEIIEEYQA